MTIGSALRGSCSTGVLSALAAAAAGSLAVAYPAAAETASEFQFQTLDYGPEGTFLTGIRGDNIVGNYTIPGTTETGGLYYNLASGAWSPMPLATPNGANFPGAIGSSPYGPSFGHPGGVLRVVGTYQTEASAPYDLSYLYDGAGGAKGSITPLAYPGGDTLYTVAHSTFGNTVVGDYDTRLATGNAFIYDIDAGTYTTNNIPGAASTTAYGVYGDKIAGGYAMALPGGGLGPEHGYIYDRAAGTYETHDHPGAVATHFEGITGAGRSDEYNLVANWITADGAVHPAVMHIDALGKTTWYEIDIPGAVVSSNSAYGEHVVGVYVAGGMVKGYLATLPGIYNPIRNTGTLTSAVVNGAALSGGKGDDIVNSGSVQVTGEGGIGMRGETYGVLTNSGTVTATGLVGAAAEMHGLFGTLLNSGTLQTAFVADALRTAPDAHGTVIVNTGIIDGRLAATGGLNKRFENSGWLGISGTGLPVTDLFGGTFVQTAAGTFAVRMTDSGNDSLGVAGTARLAGTLTADFQSSNLLKTYSVLGATSGVTGTFDSFATTGLPALYAASLDYDPTTVSIDVAANLAGQQGNTPNQSATGAALDRFIEATDDNTLAVLPSPLSPLYALSSSQLPAALGALSGEAYASEQTVMAGDSLYSRQAMLGRLRQGSYAGAAGPLGALAEGGPTTAPPASASGVTLWGQAYGAWSDLEGDAVSDISASIGGLVSGVDMRVDDWLVGAVLGYAQSSSSVAALGSSFTVDSLLVGLYGSTRMGPWNVRFGASYAFDQIDADRLIAYPGSLQRANAEYDGGTAQVFGEVGYGLAVQGVALEPFAGLAYVNVDTAGFTESGATAGLSGSSDGLGVGYGQLGLRVATSMALTGGTVLQPRAALAWQYAFGDTTPSASLAFLSVPGAQFSVSGVPVAQNTALVELGADLVVGPTARVSLAYVGQFADDASDNAVQANVGWSF